MLLTFLQTKSPIDKFLANCVEAQDTTGTSLTVNHMIMLRECWKLHKMYGNNLATGTKGIVPMKHIETKYSVPKYIVSRNAIMLSEKGVEDKSLVSGRRQGRGWLKIVPLSGGYSIGDDEEKLQHDTRNKGIKLTKKGERVCDILFGDLKEVY